MSKILIIEDDRFLRELIVRKLKDQDFEVIEAIDGERGLQIIKEQSPDLILLDLILPGIDGFEVLEKIKDKPKLSSIPVVILSNLGQREDVERGMKLGAVDYLVKAHFTPNEVIDIIKKSLKNA